MDPTHEPATVAANDRVTADRLAPLIGCTTAVVIEVNPDQSVLVRTPEWFDGIDAIRIQPDHYRVVPCARTNKPDDSSN